MSCRILTLSLVLALCLMGGQAQGDPQISIVAEGLYYPAGLALLVDGSVLIAEAGGHGERSAGISLLQPDGSLGRLISNIPSAYAKEHLISAPAVAVSPDGGTIVVGLAGAQLYSLSSGEAESLPVKALTPNYLTRRQADRGNIFLLHPFDIAFDSKGAPVVTDAAINGLVIESDDGSISYLHRFAALENPKQNGGRLEAIPTGITRYDDSYYVTLFGGCPHVTNGGELVAVGADGGQTTVVDGLNMPVDIAIDAAGNLWILEFAALALRNDCFTDLYQQASSGRLSRINGQGVLETIVDGLHFPTSVLPLPDGSLYIAESYSGRILHLEFEADPPSPKRFPPLDKPPSSYIVIQDYDQALRTVIDEYELTPYPGRDLVEPESDLTRLGRDLFFDPILSGDQNISCATCHHPEFAMTDGRVLPIGAGGQGLGESRAFRKMINTNLDSGRTTPCGLT